MKLIISSFILVLFSCNASKETAGMKDFPSGKYEVVELNDEGFELKKPYIINFNTEEQRISGIFDCNNFSSEYKKEDNNIDFGYAISTKMYCDGDMKNEDTFFRNLNKMKSFKFDGEILEFVDENKKLILKLKKLKS